jgi:3-hydroxybutyryl-CoA dehydrogenase
MRIVIAATDSQWEEWPGIDDKTEWVRVADGNVFAENKDADAFINLKETKLFPSYSELQKPVLINAVTGTLSAMAASANVIRFNGWPGFLQRGVWEVAGKINDATANLFEHLDKKIIIVADEPGFISARIIAMIINEAYFATGDKVSSREEIDTAMKLGTNYPFGPFEWARAIGPANVLQLLQRLYETDKRYEPAPLLCEEANINLS